MIIHLNGNEVVVRELMTIAAVVAEQKLDPLSVVVEQNMHIVRRENWDTTVVGNGDQIELLSFVGGG
ncbi:MAG: sulfur carrier protein ThiS [Spirochaetes bacterium]|nr:sulfur carrier protein ThiS [Spirochaetota bacterium]